MEKNGINKIGSFSRVKNAKRELGVIERNTSVKTNAFNLTQLPLLSYRNEEEKS